MLNYSVHIPASKPHGTLHIGVTNSLIGRVIQHRDEFIEGFTKRYGIKSLAYYEAFDDVLIAIQREKSLERWPRAWKINLIERENPRWSDLFSLLTAVSKPTDGKS